MSLPQELHVESQYAEGYVPSSLDAPHSSLHRSATWLGMGCILACLAGWGMMVFGLASHQIGSQDSGMTYAIIGGVIGAVLMFGGFFLVYLGRANYREYKERTGRIH